jgi:hypothetical protein
MMVTGRRFVTEEFASLAHFSLIRISRALCKHAAIALARANVTSKMRSQVAQESASIVSMQEVTLFDLRSNKATQTTGWYSTLTISEITRDPSNELNERWFINVMNVRTAKRYGTGTVQYDTVDYLSVLSQELTLEIDADICA